MSPVEQVAGAPLWGRATHPGASRWVGVPGTPLRARVPQGRSGEGGPQGILSSASALGVPVSAGSPGAASEVRVPKVPCR